MSQELTQEELVSNYAEGRALQRRLCELKAQVEAHARAVEYRMARESEWMQWNYEFKVVHQNRVYARMLEWSWYWEELTRDHHTRRAAGESRS